MRTVGLRLHGLHVKVGPDEPAYVACPAAVGNMIAEMAQIYRHHRTMLTRIGLDYDVGSADWGIELGELAAGIDEAVGEACESLRFPRPRVLLSVRLPALGQVPA